jgi:hypothetical protein
MIIEAMLFRVIIDRQRPRGPTAIEYNKHEQITKHQGQESTLIFSCPLFPKTLALLPLWNPVLRLFELWSLELVLPVNWEQPLSADDFDKDADVRARFAGKSRVWWSS